jgi:hypothetical protein
LSFRWPAESKETSLNAGFFILWRGVHADKFKVNNWKNVTGNYESGR